jgi:hypothetical protein
VYDLGFSREKPGIEVMPWGTRDMIIAGPFGNKLIFNEDPNAH